MRPQPRIHANDGSALVITLALLVLATIAVIAFATSMRTERGAASTHLERLRATMLAQQGVEQTVATLQLATADPNRYWISQPGQLVVGKPTDDSTTPNIDEKLILSDVVPLSSGPIDPANPGLDPANPGPNLNVATLQDPTAHLLTTGNDVMRVAWIYVLKDATRSTDPAFASSMHPLKNPIIGRYAFWADDESSKINYNLAWKRDPSGGNPNPAGHPSRINLTALPAGIDFLTVTMADAIHSFITPDNYKTVNRFYNSPFDARQVSTAAAALEENKFALTHYNHDPDTTFFNEPRIVLTTQARYARGRPFLNILENPGTDTAIGADPGLLANLSATSLNATVALLTNYLKRQDWPMVAPGAKSSFQQKYFQGKEERLTQLAVNIIDYVRSKESALAFVAPIRGAYDTSGNFGIDPAYYGQALSYKGITRGLHITELSAWAADKPEKAGPFKDHYKYKLFWEIHLPSDYGNEQVDLVSPPGGKAWIYNIDLNDFISPDATNDKISKGFMQIRAGDVSQTPGGAAQSILKKGGYAIVTKTVYHKERKTSLKMRAALVFGSTNGADRLDVAPLEDTDGGFAMALPNPLDISEAEIGARLPSYEVDDPRVNAHPGDWRRAEVNTFGRTNSINSVASGKKSWTTPEQDTDAAGNLSDASLYMPPPKGVSPYGLGDLRNNPDGVVISSGELGYIHTGAEGSTSASGGIPWRTMRLQPNGYTDTKAVPDWAFMDLFTVPSHVPDAARAIFQPHNTATGGRVNMNAQIEPFTNLRRDVCLVAVLKGCTSLKGDAATVAKNIYSRTLATASHAKGKPYGYPNGYDSPGEVAEIAGVADGGEQSEDLVREIANLITSRGGVFTVYTVGQSLRQRPDGQLLPPTAEQRQQAMVERFFDAEAGQLRFRTVYVRNLVP